MHTRPPSRVKLLQDQSRADKQVPGILIRPSLEELKNPARGYLTGVEPVCIPQPTGAFRKPSVQSVPDSLSAWTTRHPFPGLIMSRYFLEPK